VNENDITLSDGNDITFNSFNLNGLQFKKDIETTQMIVHKKLIWATNNLQKCDKINDCIQLTNLIKSCSDTLQSLKKFKKNFFNKLILC
jgi:hypothetical protein